MHMTKQRINLSVNKKVIQKAREHDINLSAFLEIRLREYLALIEGRRGVDGNSSGCTNSQNNITLRAGFERLFTEKSQSRGKNKVLL